MIQKLLEEDELRRYKVYVDYENIYSSTLESVHRNIQDLKFFETIQNVFDGSAKLTGIEAFADFSTEFFQQRREQLWLEQQGIQTFNCQTHNKNSTDLHLTIRAIADLYEKPNLDIFVIVTNDRDFVPLMQQIRRKDKLVVLVCSKSGANSILPNNADTVLYLEDLFKPEERVLIDETIIGNAEKISYTPKERTDALFVYQFILKSGIFKGYLSGKNQMSVNGLSTFCARNTPYTKNEVIRLLMVCAKEQFFVFRSVDGEMVMDNFELEVLFQK